MSKDYYKILGVDRNASEEEIKKSFRKISKQCHPDLQQGKSEEEKKSAEAKFKEAAEAYEVLSDKDKKSNYDNFGTADGMGGRNGASGDFFRGMDPFGDFFHNPFSRGFNFGFGGRGFGGGSREADPNAPIYGKDIQVRINIDFDDSLYGVEKKFDINIQDICSHCKGSGCDNGKYVKCPECNGDGYKMQWNSRNSRVAFTCPRCSGSGHIAEVKCSHCNGNGMENSTRHIDVNIPMGVWNGSKLKVRGEGQRGYNGGSNGDLFINISCGESEIFQRNEMDLYCKVYVSPITLSLGGKIDVPTPWGMSSVTISPGLESGKTLKLSGMGVRKNDVRGDLFIIVLADSLVELSDKQKKALKDLEKLLTPKNMKINSTMSKKFEEFVDRNKDRMVK